jgi:predicted anti-sigma-YlaC factor YlaD
MTHAHPSPECQALLSSLSDYLDGDLEQALCDRIEAHLSECQDCRLMVDTTRKTLVLYRSLNRVEIPAEALDRLWRTLEAQGCVPPSAEDPPT